MPSTLKEAFQPDPNSVTDELLEQRKGRFAKYLNEPSQAAEAPAAQPRKTSKQAVMPVGFSLLNEEQAEKRQARANRFQTESSLVSGGAQLSATTNYLGTARRNQPEAMVLSDEDMVAQRRLTAATAERRPEVVHMYGTSLLSAPECLDYFKRFEPTSVECIDENSCNISFKDGASASTAVVDMGSLLPPGQAPDHLGLAEEDVEDVTYLWHRGLGVHSQRADKLTEPLLFRIATVHDVQQQQQQHQQQGRQQGAQRQKAPHRGKGKGRGRGRGRGAHSQPSHQYQDVDAVDGDIKMQIRGERGGRREQERKRKRQLEDDVDMVDAEAAVNGEGQRTNGEERMAAAMGSEESFHRAHGHGTMFSAQNAGIRAMPVSRLYAPPVMAVQQTATDYSDV